VQVWFSNRRARLRKQLNSQQVPTFSSNLSGFGSQYEAAPLQMSSAGQTSFASTMNSWTQPYTTQQSTQSAFNHLAAPPMVTSSAALSPASLSSSPVHGSTTSAPPTTSTSSISGNNMSMSYNYSSAIAEQHNNSTPPIPTHNHLSSTPPTPPVSATAATSAYPFSYGTSFDQTSQSWRTMPSMQSKPAMANTGFEWDAAYR
jgi:paired box protein 3/7